MFENELKKEKLLYIDVTKSPYNIIDDGAISDQASKLQKAVTKGETSNIPVLLPNFAFRVGSTIQSQGKVSIVGQGDKSVIKHNCTFDVIHIGNNGARPRFQSGEIKNFQIVGDVANPSNKFRALVIDSVIKMETTKLYIKNCGIGLDYINNCYGAIIKDVTVDTGVNVALNLRSGTDSGNDITVINPWFNGRDASIHISPGFTGLHVIGGQLNTSSVAPDDLKGVVIIGKDYDTGATGNATRINIIGTDFESIQNTWGIRTFATTTCLMQGVSFLANGATSAIGVAKHDAFGQGVMDIRGHIVGGVYTNSSLIVLNGVDSSNGYTYTETGTVVNTSLTINGSSVTTLAKGMIGQSGFTATALLLTGQRVRTRFSDFQSYRVLCYNNTGVTIPSGSLVATNGRNGTGQVAVQLASTAHQAKVYGVSAESIAPSQAGYITVKGLAQVKTTGSLSTAGNFMIVSGVAGTAGQQAGVPTGFVIGEFTDTFDGDDGDPYVILG